ncbi:MAG: hypothetical protein KatS3mg061_0785 [Dehalococcoidia bacterium]|nr:MAG: hypothetical protein KatS3mg061_0785 [Dehalococcoidia bacterium]
MLRRPLSVVAMVLLALGASTPPLSAAGLRPTEEVASLARRSVVGQVVRVDGGQLVVRLASGEERTFLLSKRTAIEVWGQPGSASLAALTPGATVSILAGGQKAPDRAVRVVVLPAGKSQSPARPGARQHPSEGPKHRRAFA